MPIQWTWRAGALTNAEGHELASVRDGVLATTAGERLTLESSLDSSSPRFFLRAQTAAGEDFSVTQAGITVTRLRATCADREYLLERRNPFRRERRIVAPRHRRRGCQHRAGRRWPPRERGRAAGARRHILVATPARFSTPPRAPCAPSPSPAE